MYDVYLTKPSTIGPASGYGQNIAYGVGSTEVDKIITDMMYNDEMMYYQDLYGQASPDMSNFEHWGHFSQIVWVNTASVGCATVTCSPLAESNSNDALPFTVCNYFPAGMSIFLNQITYALLTSIRQLRRRVRRQRQGAQRRPHLHCLGFFLEQLSSNVSIQ
jgi:hypothetical protein